MIRSQQGVNIAFIGMNHKAQTACAEYLKRKHHFKRLNMDDALKRFLRTSYWAKRYTNIPFEKRLDFYDAIYKIDPEIFIKHVEGRMKTSSIDTVIFDVRYLNEIKALQDMGFTVVRVTTNTKYPNVRRYARKGTEGTVAVSLMYDTRFAVNHKVDYSINWTSKATTGDIIDPLLERIGFKLDL